MTKQFTIMGKKNFFSMMMNTHVLDVPFLTQSELEWGKGSPNPINDIYTNRYALRVPNSNG